MPKSPKYRIALGENIRSCRRNARLSQERLAEKADLHPVFIGRVERGEVNVSVDALVRIADAIDISVQDFFVGV